MEKRLLIVTGVNSALIDKRRNVSQQYLNFIRVFKNIYKSLFPAGFHKCPTEFYFLQISCLTGCEKLFAALHYALRKYEQPLPQHF